MYCTCTTQLYYVHVTLARYSAGQVPRTSECVYRYTHTHHVCASYECKKMLSAVRVDVYCSTKQTTHMYVQKSKSSMATHLIVSPPQFK